MSERYKRLNHGSRTQLAMAQRPRKNHDFLKLLTKCTPAQQKAILKVADEALVRTICECILNVFKETVPVSKPAKGTSSPQEIFFCYRREKHSASQEKENFGATRRKLFRCSVTTCASCAELDSHLKMNYTRRMVLAPENTLERIQQRQQILTPVTQTLKTIDSEMNDILSSKQLTDEEKAKLYNQVLQRRSDLL